MTQQRSYRRILRHSAGAVLAGILGLSLLGCRAESHMSKSDEANFNGGPMPPGFLEKHGGGPKPPSAPGAAAPAAATSSTAAPAATTKAPAAP